MTEHHATIRSADIVYERSGAGPDLIWGHGLSQTRATEGLLGLFDWSKVDANVVRYDARGHGKSETTADLNGYSWLELARDQVALADHIGIDTYICAGASMGCGTALHVATQAPERLTHLVLAIPPTGWETRAEQAAVWELNAQMIETEGVEAVITARAEMDPPDPFIGDEVFRAQQAEATRAWDPARLADIMRGAGKADLPPREDIAKIKVPTLILAWTGDPIHPVSTADELQELIPHASRHIVSTKAELGTWTGLLSDFIAG